MTTSMTPVLGRTQPDGFIPYQVRCSECPWLDTFLSESLALDALANHRCRRVRTVTLPTFSMGDVGMFFGRSASWLRWREAQGAFRSPHHWCNPKRVKNARVFTLGDIDDLAGALYDNNVISERQRGLCLQMTAMLRTIHEAVVPL